MIGTVIGDVVGSVYEFDNIRRKDFPLFSEECEATDDSIMAIAVADAIMEAQDKGAPFQQVLCEKFRSYGARYPYPMGSYGGNFSLWLRDENMGPYNSCGNGSAMRVAACGFAARNLEEARELAAQSAAVTHNHPDGIAGAQAVAEAIFLARHGGSKQDIENAVKQYYPEIPESIEALQKTYHWGSLCSDTVPQAVACFLQSDSFEDAIRNAISIGGDSDTLGAITGGIAEAFYGVPEEIAQEAKDRTPPELVEVLERFEKRYQNKKG